MKYAPHCPVFLLLVFLSFTVNGFSQIKSTNLRRLYADLGAGVSSRSGGYSELGAQMVSMNNWVATVSYHSISMEPKNLPSNYDPGVNLLSLLPFVDQSPVVKSTLASITGGRAFNAGRKVWFTTEAGISYVSGEAMDFRSQPVVTDVLYISSNYSTITRKSSSAGAMLKADFNWAAFSFLGFGVGTYLNMNSVQSSAGFHFKMIVGAMGRSPYATD